MRAADPVTVKFVLGTSGLQQPTHWPPASNSGCSPYRQSRLQNQSPPATCGQRRPSDGMRRQLAHRLIGPINKTLITAPGKLSRPQSFVGSPAASRSAFALPAEQPVVGLEIPTAGIPLTRAPHSRSMPCLAVTLSSAVKGRWHHNVGATVPHVGETAPLAPCPVA
jgi:hypothetical protein